MELVVCKMTAQVATVRCKYKSKSLYRTLDSINQLTLVILLYYSKLVTAIEQCDTYQFSHSCRSSVLESLVRRFIYDFNSQTHNRPSSSSCILWYGATSNVSGWTSNGKMKWCIIGKGVQRGRRNSSLYAIKNNSKCHCLCAKYTQ